MSRRAGRRDVKFNSVLIVDDDPVFVRAFSQEFERREWRVAVADNYFAAAATAREHRPEVILLDLMLGEYSGLDLIEELHHDAPEARIVAVSGAATLRAAVDMMKLGAVDFLEKPCTVDDVIAAATRTHSRVARTAKHVSADQNEREHLSRVINECGGNLSEAARRLRMHRRSLQRKLRKNSTDM